MDNKNNNQQFEQRWQNACRERVAAIMVNGEYHVLLMGGPPNKKSRIVWRDDGSVKTPVDGFPYIPVPGEEPVQDDLPDLVPESEEEQDDMALSVDTID